MKTRTITALCFVIVMLASVLFGAYTFAVFFVVLSLWCLTEFYGMVTNASVKPHRLVGLASGGLLFGLVACAGLGLLPIMYLMLCIPLVSLVFILELYRHSENPFTNIGYTFLGQLYVVFPFLFFFSIAFVDGSYNYRYPLGFMLMLWANDTGAYLAGRGFGKHKLFERISPNKTWEGFFGGIVLAFIVSLVLGHYFVELAVWEWVCIALIISVFGTFGDLVESMLKRSQQVKDSGSVLPGHGGLLDRFDGLLLAAPVVYGFLKVVL